MEIGAIQFVGYETDEILTKSKEVKGHTALLLKISVTTIPLEVGNTSTGNANSPVGGVSKICRKSTLYTLHKREN